MQSKLQKKQALRTNRCPCKGRHSSDRRRRAPASRRRSSSDENCNKRADVIQASHTFSRLRRSLYERTLSPDSADSYNVHVPGAGLLEDGEAAERRDDLVHERVRLDEVERVVGDCRRVVGARLETPSKRPVSEHTRLINSVNNCSLCRQYLGRVEV